MDRGEQQERFEAWVDVMDDVLEQFKGLLPREVAAKLDGSPESLQALEDWILRTYADFDAIDAEQNTTLIDGAARYLGEVFRAHLGGIWDIQLDNPKDVNYGIPLIVGYRGQQTPLAPNDLVTACTDRRTGNYFVTIFRNQAELAGKR